MSIMLSLISCSVLGPLSAKQIVHHNEDGVAQLTRDIHLIDGTRVNGSCTVFHIGNGRLLTAAHCFDPLYLTLYTNKEEESFMDTYFNHQITDAHGHVYKKIKLLKYNISHDMVLLQVEGFDGRALAIWNPSLDGTPEVGDRIISLGYPGYFARKFTFEIGLIKSISFMKTGLGHDGPFILSKGTLFPGYSGGPTLSMENGKVIGLNHAGASIPVFGGRDSVPLSLAISYTTIRKFLKDKGDGKTLLDNVNP